MASPHRKTKRPKDEAELKSELWVLSVAVNDLHRQIVATLEGTFLANEYQHNEKDTIADLIYLAQELTRKADEKAEELYITARDYKQLLVQSSSEIYTNSSKLLN